ncbi:MAG: HigA family addiction module antidote protein [Bacteroidales bacterium]|nr:HigA family addiction module antidote protein [Bacteroidales bacterium]
MAQKKKFRAVYAFHPGTTLREKLDEMGMSVKEFAVRTSKPEKTINAVLMGDSSLTPDMAVAFEQITMIPAHMWLNLQRNYDEYMARQKRESILNDEDTIAWARRFPYSIMANLGWVPATRSISEKITNLFSFFKITTANAWTNLFLNQALKSEFRLSLSGTKDPYAISAWLRQGEILADNTSTNNSYSAERLKEELPLMLKLVQSQPDNFDAQLKELCSNAGVKLIYISHITHAPVNGCARWIDNTPCIQMTDRQKRNDVFWFSFFHEIGHILLHGKKDVFLEDTEYHDQQKEKEMAADRFASDILLDKKNEQAIIREIHEKTVQADLISELADKYKTHPAIIIGRLQHLQILPQNSALNSLKATVRFN